MIRSLVHRGPDDSGTWIDEAAGIALGHRRLSVLDLSPAGHQPMVSVSGRYVIAFNGEIYNHLEIRQSLEATLAGPTWRGHSDTETLLAGFERWGIESTLKKASGMFAFALWDREMRILTLARDRLGEKPLYCGWQGGVFLFGSELKALRMHAEFRAEIDRNVVVGYMSQGYVPAGRSIYKGIRKLPPGAFLQLSERDAPGSSPDPRRYWSLRDVVERGRAEPFIGTDSEAVEELEAKLKRAISQQRIADVPLGAFLSGGIDSTTVVALMQAQSTRPIKTFTIGFHESQYQEAEPAKSVARRLGTDHTELYVTPREAMDVIPRLPAMYDEPFGDSSAIPTFLVSQLARRDVTVCLSGDGGDELFGGYSRYQRAADAWRLLSRIPYAARRGLSYGCKSLAGLGSKSVAWKADRLALYLSARTATKCYEATFLQRQDAAELVLNSNSRGGPIDEIDQLDSLPSADLYDTMMYTDAAGYLPDDILTKVDRASMAVSLEVRVPMLDHRIVEFAWRLPLRMKVRSREAKWLLKRVLHRYVPALLMDRPKMGFGVPVGQWIRGPLREWAEDLLSEERIRRDGFLDARMVSEQWSRHLNDVSSGGDGIWQLLMFQAWLKAPVDSPSMQAGGVS
jgi:asparagine synthase (glutamine-hydrolysing)